MIDRTPSKINVRLPDDKAQLPAWANACVATLTVEDQEGWNRYEQRATAQKLEACYNTFGHLQDPAKALRLTLEILRRLAAEADLAQVDLPVGDLESIEEALIALGVPFPRVYHGSDRARSR